jgi:hypothetical protein
MGVFNGVLSAPRSVDGPFYMSMVSIQECFVSWAEVERIEHIVINFFIKTWLRFNGGTW